MPKGPTNRIVYGLDTGSIEDYSQCVIVDLPGDLEPDDYEDYISSNVTNGGDPLPSQQIVGWDDMVDSFTLAMRGEGVSEEVINNVIGTVFDAVDYND